jgi:guanylate kinase
MLFDIDVKGAMSLLDLYGERVLLIFIDPPSIETLEKRLLDRKGDSISSIETRLRNANDELAWKNRFDYRIVNDDLKRAYAKLKEIVSRECR